MTKPIEGGQVLVEVSRDGVSLASFPLNILGSGAEQTLCLSLAAAGIPYTNAAERALDAARLLAESRLAIFDGGGGSSVQHEAEVRAEAMLHAPDLLEQVRRDMVILGFRADPDIGVTLLLCKLSALTPEPVYVYITGPASSLKTRYADIIALTTPPEMLRHLTDLTPRALYYGAADLSYFVIVLDEMDLKGRGIALDQKLLRMLFSKGWCEIEVTRGGKSVRRRVRGPVQVIQTTVATRFDEQDLSRHLLIELADSPDRTDIVLNMMGEYYSGQSDQHQIDLIAETHRAIHRRLPRGAAVNVPFAPVLAAMMPRDSILVLRAFRTLMSLVKSSAILHCYQRKMDSKGQIIATLEDYRIVYSVARDLISQSVSGQNVPSPAQVWLRALLHEIGNRAFRKANSQNPKEHARLLKRGKEAFLAAHSRWDTWLTLNELIEISGRPRTTVQRFLEQLVAAGWVEERKAGRAKVYRLATGDGQVPNCPQLPSPEEVERGHMGT